MEKNAEEGIRLYTAAAELGYVKAQVNLASCYEQGDGVSTDLEKAKYWYQQAANQGDGYAIQALAQLCN